MVGSEQKKDLPKGFIKHLLGHGRSYTDLIAIELNQFWEDIMGQFSPTQHIHHVPLMEYGILYN